VESVESHDHSSLYRLKSPAPNVDTTDTDARFQESFPMNTRPAGSLRRLGLLSPVFMSLMVFAGLAAATYVAGRMEAGTRPDTANQSPRAVVSEGTAKSQSPLETTASAEPARESLAVVQSWAFESEGDGAATATTTKKRHHQVSASNGKR
jgi:hypothetical protein